MSDMDAPGTVRKKRFPVRLDTPQACTSRKTWGATTSSIVPKAKTGYLAAQRSVSSSSAQAAVPGNMNSLRLRMAQRLYVLGIRNENVLKAMAKVPRHEFIDTALSSQAYEDTSLPIGLGQTISKPSVVARMIELIMPTDDQVKMHRVLEIGTGCGYQAAVLSQVVNEVYSIERLKGLHERARINLRPMHLTNVHLIYGDGMLGFPSGAPYDAIIAAAGGQEIPVVWLEQLAVGGCLVAPVISNAGTQALVKVERTLQGWQQYVLEAVQFVPLKSGVS